MAIRLAPGANALTTADAVKKRALELASSFPPEVPASFDPPPELVPEPLPIVIIRPASGSPVQHWMLSGPGQKSAVDMPPIDAQVAVSIQTPI